MEGWVPKQGEARHLQGWGVVLGGAWGQGRGSHGACRGTEKALVPEDQLPPGMAQSELMSLSPSL